MGLYQRIVPGVSTKISVHAFGAALRQLAAGQLTRTDVINMFALAGDEVTQLDAIIATYTALPSNNTANTLAKAQWVNRMEDVFILVEEGFYDEPKAKSALGF